jgi:hypothetical protein
MAQLINSGPRTLNARLEQLNSQINLLQIQLLDELRTEHATSQNQRSFLKSRATQYRISLLFQKRNIIRQALTNKKPTKLQVKESKIIELSEKLRKTKLQAAYLSKELRDMLYIKRNNLRTTYSHAQLLTDIDGFGKALRKEHIYIKQLETRIKRLGGELCQ